VTKDQKAQLDARVLKEIKDQEDVKVQEDVLEKDVRKLTKYIADSLVI